MTNGILVFEGMTVGILPGDLTISFEECRSINSSAILSTAYNVLPIWLRIASDQLRFAKQASDGVATKWAANDEINRELLVAELEPSLQVFVACGIAVDALYDQLRPFAKLTQADVQAWKRNKTARETQIHEVVRRVYKLQMNVSAEFKQNIGEILKYRDMAVHPSLELKQTCVRPDVPVGVDWKFSAYKYSNAAKCFEFTMKMLLHLYEKKSGNKECDQQMENIVKALEQLKVVTRKAST
jgi:hypothetical protein